MECERIFNNRIINRRDFLRAAIFTSIGLSLPFNHRRLLGKLCAEDAIPDIAVAGGTSPGKTTAAAIKALGGMKRFISVGDVVVVKPNIGWDRKPEFAANTNPEVVEKLVLLCLEAGAKEVRVFDRPVNNPLRCYRQSGIEEAVKRAGGRIFIVDARKFKKVRMNGLSLREWPLYSDILEADKVINVPIAKTHSLATLTLGMKNLMGAMGGWRSLIHQRLDESLVDIAMAIKPELVVLDAVRILTASGPQGGDLADVKILNTVIAGTDQVAIDAYGATLFGLKPSDLGVVRVGNSVGLGTMDLSELKILKFKA